MDEWTLFRVTGKALDDLANLSSKAIGVPAIQGGNEQGVSGHVISRSLEA